MFRRDHFFASLLFVCFISLFSFRVHAETNPSATPAFDEKNLLHKLFGPIVRIDGKHTPSQWKGDFNGDGVEDILFLVIVEGKKAALANGVNAANLFSNQANWKNAPQDLPAKRGFALVLGNSPSKYLFIDTRESGIFDTPLWENASTKEIVKIFKKGNKQAKDYPSYVPPTAKGDIIFMMTEGADSILYFDGQHFRWLEAPEME